MMYPQIAQELSQVSRSPARGVRAAAGRVGVPTAGGRPNLQKNRAAANGYRTRSGRRVLQTDWYGASA